MSPPGTFRTRRDVRVESAMRFKADIGGDGLFNRSSITVGGPLRAV